MENMVINTETVVCRLKEVRIGLGLTQRQEPI